MVVDWTRVLGICAFVAASTLGASEARAQRVVYLNFEPTTLVDNNGQNPTTNSFSSANFVAGPISGWPRLTDDDKAALLFLLKEATVPFDIVYTFERPAMGEYDMVVYGTQADKDALFPMASCSGAIGLSDCSDGNLENISFVFYGCLTEAQQTDMRRITYHTLTSLGFGWGLENLSANGQLMGGFSVFGLHFGDTCVAVSGGASCPHVGCADGQQNSTADLLDRIGMRVDDGPPTLEVLQPDDGAIVPPDFAVSAVAEDGFGGMSVTLEIVEPGIFDEDVEPPYEWSLSGVPKGAWTLRVIAVDADGNEVVDERTVCVEECIEGTTGDSAGTDSGGGTTGDGPSTVSAGPTGPSDDSGGATDDGGSATDGTSAGSLTTFDPGGSALGPAGGGCHCTTSGARGNGGTVLGVGLLGLGFTLRRRRNDRATRG